VYLFIYDTVIHFLTVFIFLLMKIINPKSYLYLYVSVAVRCFYVLLSLIKAQLCKFIILIKAKYRWNHQNFALTEEVE